MECPRCQKTTVQHELGDQRWAYVCEHCGWGRQRLEQLRADGTGEFRRPLVSLVTLLKLAGLWVLSLTVVFGPLLALWWFGTYWLAGDPLAEDLGQRLVDAVLVHYWWVMGLYLLMSLALAPSYDPDNMGIFGPGIAGNIALTPEQHANRALYSLHGLLLPGKLVWITLGATWQIFRALVRGPRA